MEVGGGKLHLSLQGTVTRIYRLFILPAKCSQKHYVDVVNTAGVFAKICYIQGLYKKFRESGYRAVTMHFLPVFVTGGWRD